MKHHLITAAILLVALTFYGLGLVGLGLVAFISGGICELWFWVRLISRRSPTGKEAIHHD
ncbi:MAG: hypothetical protein EPN17_09765 [Methylobacter sp.]|nr:MAG: hypothetical protein EPN17_09765 [Methylobacter sp.]